MKRKSFLILIISLLILAFGVRAIARAQGSTPDEVDASSGNPFTYQGQLKDASGPVTDTCDFQLSLWNDLASGTQVGSTLTQTGVAVSEGLFTVQLDFGAYAFNGSARWLEIAVRCPAGSGSYTTLVPRQPLTPAPFALYSLSSANADTLDGQHGSFYQTRVSGTCAVGSTIQAINSDGTVICQVDAPLNRPIQPTDNVLSTLDSAGDVGHYTSITIGADGLGLISYYDNTNQDLKVAHCTDAICSVATTSTLDSDGDVGTYTSIAIGADGLGLISYHDNTNNCLKVAHCSNSACTAATISTLDSPFEYGMNIGQYSSITIGADGLGLISYMLDWTGSEFHDHYLRVAHCSDTVCSAAMVSTMIDVDSWVGWSTSITTGADGLGLISYRDDSPGELRVAHCSDTICSTATVTILDNTGAVGWDTSITIGTDGLGLISYHPMDNHDLKVAHCSDIVCSAATLTTLDSTGDTGAWTSITIGADGLGLISYNDWDNHDLKVAHCMDTICSAATLIIMDSAGDVGWDTAVTIGTDGLGLISYWDSTNGVLKAAHCSNAFCVPYFRRR
jgi:hypothetical protein